MRCERTGTRSVLQNGSSRSQVEPFDHGFSKVFGAGQDRASLPGVAEEFRRKLPAVELIQDSVENVRAICDRAGIDSVDCIVCGLPWAAFPDDLQKRLLDAMGTVLRPGGQFVTFAYLHGLPLPAGRRFAKRLPEYFREVGRSRTVWMNVPPALVYRCRR